MIIACCLWCTDPLLHKQIPIRTMGFLYKTVAFYWIKLIKIKLKITILKTGF